MKTLTRCRRMVSRFVVSAALVLPVATLATTTARAQDEEEPTTDARLEGFSADVKVENDSTSLAWLFFALLAVIGLSPLFKDAKRTHLD